MSMQSPRESRVRFTGAVPVLPTTDLNRATSFYGQLGFQVLHQEAEYAIVTRDGVELHLWLSPERSLAEQSSCRIQVTGLEALYEEYQTRGLLAPDAAVRAKPWGNEGAGGLRSRPCPDYLCGACSIGTRQRVTAPTRSTCHRSNLARGSSSWVQCVVLLL